MRRTLALLGLLALAACGGSPESGRSRWVGAWTLDRERSAKSVLEFGKAEREKMKEEMKGGGPLLGSGGAPKGGDPSDDQMLRQARGWMQGMKADLDLREDGTATADLFFGGVPVRYSGTWSEVGAGAEMRIVSRAEGVLQGRDTIPIRFTRDGEFLTIGGERDANGALRQFAEINSVITFRRMYLVRRPS